MTILSVDIRNAGYERNTPVIRDIRFSIERGELIGLIGANGAGKSSTIKSIMGAMQFMEGDIERNEKSRLSYIPERPVFYDELTLKEHIDFIAAIEQIPESTLQANVSRLLQQFGMEKHLHELPGAYSKGMQQKALIILALMIEPELLIIDEPFMGLDPIATKELLQLIRREQERGAGILMCTHVLDTAEKLCDRFVMLHSGQMLANGTLGDLQSKSNMPGVSLFECYHRLIEDNSNE